MRKREDVGLNLKQGCTAGCLVLFSAAVIVMGAATWYSREINREYKVVQRTEKALLAATRDAPFVAPAEPTFAPARLEAFLAVRDSLAPGRQVLAAMARRFARGQDDNRNRGLKGLLDQVRSGSDLAPVYATYWSTRNRVLLEYGMGPAEYIWFYSTIYYTWLEKDPADGRDFNASAPPVQAKPGAPLSPASRDQLAPHRLRLEANYDAVVNPVELIFAETTGTQQ